MFRTKIILALSLIAVPAAHAEEAHPIVLVHEGERFEYYVKLDNDDIKIDGILTTNGEKFSLTVRPSGRVKGYFGKDSVDYSVGKSTHDRVAARLKRQQFIAMTDASNR